MTVVEKIWELQDELLELRFEKSYDERANARKAQIRAQLENIRQTCPVSWARAERRD